MNEKDQKKQNHEESPKNIMGEPVEPVSAWKRVLSKRWVYPAAYVAAAAIILTLVWVYQNASQKPMDSTPASVTDNVDISGNGQPTSGTVDIKEGKGTEGTAVETTASAEDLVWPVANPAEVTVVKPFYDKEGTPEDHQAALVQHNDTFYTNDGIDLARADDKTFEVKAAMSGKVTRAEEHPLIGYVVEITHASNLKTVYESLSDVKVKVNDEVKQGDVLANSGRNEFEKELGNHVHFAVHENGELINPISVLPKN